MINQLNSYIIAYSAYHFDRVCRSELSIGNITSERDYVSNLSTHFRFQFGPFVNMQIGYARSLESNLEQLFGCDSIVIFKKNNHVKIGLFEAKWPRYFTNFSYSWDNMLTSNSNYAGISRFNSQLLRQQNWIRSGAVIWEMFFNEQSPGITSINWDLNGSSCLSHKDALSYKNTNNVILWDNHHLNNALYPAVNLRRIVFNMLRCNWGRVLEVSENTTLLVGLEDIIEIPLIFEQLEGNDGLAVFFERSGINNYLAINLDNIQLMNE